MSINKKDKLIFESVRERDIDILFIEEWNTNIKFAIWFIKTIFGEADFITEPKGYHSVSADNLGETDIYLEYVQNREKRIILVENKIDAIAQDKQGSRYKKRAENLMEEESASVSVCMIAPKRYIDNDKEAKEYEYHVSYEDIKEWYEKQNDIRSKYRSYILQLAINQERRGYKGKEDKVVTKFWHDYWEMLSNIVPDAYMKEPVIIPEGSDWPNIFFEWMPKNYVIKHKLSIGAIDLETRLGKNKADVLKSKTEYKELKTIQTGKSVSFRISVPKIDRHLSIYDQIERIKDSFEAIKKMNFFGLEIKDEICK